MAFFGGTYRYYDVYRHTWQVVTILLNRHSVDFRGFPRERVEPIARPDP